MAVVAISALPASTTIVTGDVMPAVITAVTKKITIGNFRTQVFAFAANDPLNCGVLTATGNSTITGTLSGVTTLTATSLVLSGTITGITALTAASLVLSGSITGATSIAMGGALTGATTGAFSGALTALSGIFTDVAPGVKIGTNPASGGAIRLPNAVHVYARNAANTADIHVLGTNVSDQVQIDANGQGVTFGSGASRLIPGATSFSVRNNANTLDNLLISDAGLVTVRAGLTITAGPITMGAATTKIAMPAGGIIDFRAASDASSVLYINDAGAVQINTGKLGTKTSATGGAGFNVPHGAAPTSPIDGDMWSTTTTLNFRLNGVTKTVTLT